MGQWLQQWLASRVSLGASTSRSYRAHINDWLIPYPGTIPLPDLMASDVQAMFTAIITRETALGQPVTPATLHRIHATLRAALNTVVRTGLIPATRPATPNSLRQPGPGRRCGSRR